MTPQDKPRQSQPFHGIGIIAGPGVFGDLGKPPFFIFPGELGRDGSPNPGQPSGFGLPRVFTKIVLVSFEDVGLDRPNLPHISACRELCYGFRHPAHEVEFFQKAYQLVVEDGFEWQGRRYKSLSEIAGAVTVRLLGVLGHLASQKLGQVSGPKRAMVVKDEAAGATVRVFPQPRTENGALARAVHETATKEGWKVEELHTEEGRLDEVFRSITLPETMQKKEQ